MPSRHVIRFGLYLSPFARKCDNSFGGQEALQLLQPEDSQRHYSIHPHGESFVTVRTTMSSRLGTALFGKKSPSKSTLSTYYDNGAASPAREGVLMSQVVLIVGTLKGAFLCWSDEQRR